MSEKGFTLVELLIVLALTSLVSGLSLVLSFGTHRGTVFWDDVELVTNQLYQARAAAIQNKDGQAHGVKIGTKQLITFTGTDYQSNSASNISFSTDLSPVERPDLMIIFQPVSGATNTPTTFTLSNGLNRSQITINEEGTIIY